MRGAPANRGFTLVELIVVIAILVILAALLLPVIGSVRKRANVAATTNNLKQTGAAIALYMGDNNNAMPASGNTGGNPAYAYGLQPSVHTWVRLLSPNHKGSGAYNDPGTRLGAHLAPYVGVTGKPNDEVAIPCLRDPGWLAVARANGAEVEKYWAIATFVLRKEISAASYPQIQGNIYPFGTDGGSPQNLKDSMNYIAFSQNIGMTSRTWAIIQSDLGLIADSKNTISPGMVGNKAPAKPVNGNYRLALMFDWSVQAIPAGTDLRKPLE